MAIEDTNYKNIPIQDTNNENIPVKIKHYDDYQYFYNNTFNEKITIKYIKHYQIFKNHFKDIDQYWDINKYVFKENGSGPPIESMYKKFLINNNNSHGMERKYYRMYEDTSSNGPLAASISQSLSNNHSHLQIYTLSASGLIILLINSTISYFFNKKKN